MPSRPPAFKGSDKLPKRSALQGLAGSRRTINDYAKASPIKQEKPRLPTLLDPLDKANARR